MGWFSHLPPSRTLSLIRFTCPPAQALDLAAQHKIAPDFRIVQDTEAVDIWGTYLGEIS